MNITMDELSLKKVKFGAEPASSQTETETQAPVESNPEKGMNALTFMGIRNLMSNPKLAQEVGVPAEEPKSEPNADAKSYVAPYSSNIAFQGGKKKLIKSITNLDLFVHALKNPKTVGTGAVALGTLATACVKQEVAVDVDLSVLTELAAQMRALAEQQGVTNQALNDMTGYMLQLIEMVKDGNITQAQFYQMMFDYMVMNNANQQMIIDQLVKNGKTQEEANKLIKQLIDMVKNGTMSAEEAWGKILDMLGQINGNLANILKELINTRKVLHGDLMNVNSNLQTIIQGQNKLSQEIKALGSKIDLSNASLAEIAANLDNISIDDLKALLIQINGSINMKGDEIIKAIDSNTAAIRILAGATQQLALEVREGRLSQEAANRLFEQMLNAANNNLVSIYNEIKRLAANNPAMLAMLEKIYNRMGDLLNGQDEQIAEAGRQTIILNAILEMLKNGIPNDKLDVIIDLLDKGNLNLEKLMRMVCAMNQNVTELGAEGRQYAAAVLAALEKLISQGNTNIAQNDIIIENLGTITNLINSLKDSTGSQAEALRQLLQTFLNTYTNNSQVTNATLADILEAIGNIKLDESGCNFDPESLKPILDELRAIYNELKAIGADVAAIKAQVNVIASMIQPLIANVQGCDAKLQTIINLMIQNAEKFLEKGDEIIDAINNHKCCDCNCGGGNSGHEGIIPEIQAILNS